MHFSGLFRSQAVAFQQHRLPGDVLLIPTLSSTIAVAVLLIFTVLASYILMSSQYHSTAKVNGWLEPDKGIIHLYPPSSGGTISGISVAEGDYVEEGQALFVMQFDSVLADNSNVNQQLLEEYEYQLAILKDNKARIQDKQFQQQALLQENINSLAFDITQLHGMYDLLKQRQHIIQAQVDTDTKLVTKGLYSQRQLEQNQLQLLSLNSEISQYERDIEKQQLELITLQTKLSQLPQETAAAIADIDQQQSKLTQQINQLRGQSQMAISASRSGILSSLNVHIGQQPKTGLPLASIVPANSKMEATLLVPVQAAGFVQPGQTIAIRYDAFPYQQFGIYQAKIQSVTQSLRLPQDFASSPVPITTPVYVVKAAIDDTAITAYASKVTLRPGMTFSADIGLRQQSLLDWLLEPLYRFRGGLHS
jgi:membrane fusion protein